MKLLAAEQCVDQLLHHCPLLVDDGQVQRPACVVGRETQEIVWSSSWSRGRGGGVAEGRCTDVSPLASWTPHRWRCAASNTRASPLLQKCRRAAAVWRALADERLWRTAAAETTGERGELSHGLAIYTSSNTAGVTNTAPLGWLVTPEGSHASRPSKAWSKKSTFG